jgi:signal peptidase I
MDTATGADTSSAPAGSYVTDAARADALRQVNRASRIRLGWLWEWAKVVQCATVLFLIVRAFFVEAYKIPSGSMEGTLLVGDFLLVNKLAYGAEVPFTGRRLPRLREPARGDVVVFQWPEDLSKNFVKRLVGLPGDTLAMRDGILMVNGRSQAESYAIHTEPGVDPSFEDFRWQRSTARRRFATRRAGRVCWRRRPTRRVSPTRSTGRRETTGVRWSSHPRTTSCWGTTATTRSTAATGGSSPTRSCEGGRWSSITATLPTARTVSPGSRPFRWSRVGERVQ